MDGKKIKIGNTIFVVESAWTDAENRIIHHVENYSKMAVGKKYTLYLGYNPKVDNFYPIGLLYGKVPVDPSEKNFYGNFKNEHIKEVIRQLQGNP